MRPTILGIKKGMTQIFDTDGARVPVTVIEAGPVYVLQVKTAEGKDGYDAIQVGFQDVKDKNAKKPEKGHSDKAGVAPKRFVREIRTSDAAAFEKGQQITVDVFQGVFMVDVQGTSKGKGWQGTIKKWHFNRQRASHGNSLTTRAPGSMGRHYSINKGVPKGKHMSGHMGNAAITQRGLDVVKVDVERNLLLLKGAVPGAVGNLVIITKSLKDLSLDPAPMKPKPKEEKKPKDETKPEDQKPPETKPEEKKVEEQKPEEKKADKPEEKKA
jgi:large subunit ribosomal protein L3